MEKSLFQSDELFSYALPFIFKKTGTKLSSRAVKIPRNEYTFKKATFKQLFLVKIMSLFNNLLHGLRSLSEEIAFTARLKINSHSQMLWYSRSIFCLPHRPKLRLAKQHLRHTSPLKNSPPEH